MTQWGLDNLFNPGKRHMDDEKRRLQSTREEIGDNSGGRRIDLEGGTVSISVRRPTDVAVDDPTEADDTALEPALEVEDVPALALSNDEAEIVPEVVDETVASAEGIDIDEVLESVAVVEVEPAEPAVVEAAVEPEPEPVREADPEPAPVAVVSAEAPEPVVVAPRRKQLSASAWSRRG